MNNPIWMHQLFAIFKREMRTKMSYRMTMVTSSLSIVAGLVAFGFLGNTSVVSVTTSAYGMSLSSFLVSGVAFAPIITNGLGLFSGYLYPSQIEAVMTTPTGFRQYLMFSAVLPISTSIASAILSFTAGVLLFGLSYSYNVPALILVILLGLGTSVGLGFLGSALQLVYKQTSVLSWLLYAFTGIAGNMLVPTQVLPGTIQDMSLLTPQYYFFTGIRAALGSNVAPLATILVLFGMYAVSLNVCGYFALARSLKYLRQNGTYTWS